VEQNKVIKKTIEIIQKLIDADVGQAERLEAIKDRLEIRGSIFESDKTYLKTLTGLNQRKLVTPPIKSKKVPLSFKHIAIGVPTIAVFALVLFFPASLNLNAAEGIDLNIFSVDTCESLAMEMLDYYEDLLIKVEKAQNHELSYSENSELWDELYGSELPVNTIYEKYVGLNCHNNIADWATEEIEYRIDMMGYRFAGDSYSLYDNPFRMILLRNSP